MLEVKNLVKTYRPKGGVEVKALDDVSVTFPETGMVFLLGKSGSGKSTLLNVCGGLDTPDSGEIIIFGRSSKTFSDGDFDSYRNTFVGFIFQEYNILNEFTVEENLALALELQGKSKNAQKVDELLELVDLKGFEKRKPNTLSGGQKQRIAIARALIKEPKIIMADEPTGALDSATGKQVLDTLKKLSKTRLVIIVSHDVEFAEIYGDRIIELKDGKIISDVTKEKVAAQSSGENISVIAGDTLSLKSGSGATEADMKKIEQFIRSSGGNVIISNGSQSIAAFRQANRIDESGSSERFKRTEEDDIHARTYGKDDCKLVRSRLPILKAARIGVSSLKVKPFRLFLTILLSFAAFLLFGVFTSMMMYNPTDVLIRGYADSDYSGIVLNKKYMVTNIIYDSDGNPTYDYSYEELTQFTPEELQNFTKDGRDAVGLFSLGDRLTASNVQRSGGMPATLTEDNIDYLGYAPEGSAYRNFLAGAYPQNNGEVAISDFYLEILKNSRVFGVQESGGHPVVTSEEFTVQTAQDALGKYLYFDVYGQGGTYPLMLKISGVFSAGEMPEEFKGWNSLEEAEAWLPEQLNAFNDYIGQTLARTVLVTQNFYTDFVEETGWTDPNRKVDYERYFSYGDMLQLQNHDDYYFGVQSYRVYNSSAQDMLPVIWFGEQQSALRDDQIVISMNDASELIWDMYSVDDPSAYHEKWQQSYGEMYSQKYSLAYEIYDHYMSLRDQANNEGNYDLAESYEEYVEYYYDLWYVYDYATASGAATADAISFLRRHADSDIASAQDIADLQDMIKNFFNMFYADEPLVFYNERDNNVLELYLAGVYDEMPIYNANYNTGAYVSQKVYSSVREGYISSEDFTNYVAPADAIYSAIYLSYDGTRAAIADIAAMIDVVAADDSFVSINSPLYDSVMGMDMMVSQLSAIFLYVGIGLAVFAALLLFNFISVSISSKTHEIGVLRAVGARGWDVFKIFLVEAVVIAAICLVLAIICSIVGVYYINVAITAGMGIGFTLFSFNILSVLMMLGVAAVVVFLGTFLPVFRISRKKPVESMRTL